LHRAFLCDVYSALTEKDAGYDVFIYYVPEGDPNQLEQLLPGKRVLLPQRGETLGDRMRNAFAETFASGYRRCVLVGSDIPLLERNIVCEAFRLLDNYDIVLNPTEDGGYYLIGLSGPCRQVFELEEYGTSTVFEKTVSAAVNAGKTVVSGARLMDIDDPAELYLLIEKLKQESPDTCPETRKALKEIRGLRRD